MTQPVPFPDLKPVLYALGALAPAARAELERRRQTDAALDAELSVWEQRLAPMALTAPPATPSAALWDRIDAAIEATGSPPDDPAWTASGPGTRIMPLLWDGAGELRTFMLRLESGAVLPAHTPDQDRDYLVLTGELITETGRLDPGNSIVVRKGSACAAMHSPGGAILYVSARPA